MDSRERIPVLINHQHADRVPLMPITMMFTADQIGAKYLKYVTDDRVVRGNPEARAVVTAGHNPWDGWLIAFFIEEAGGVVTDRAGNPYSACDCSHLIPAANPEDYEAILRVMEGSTV